MTEEQIIKALECCNSNDVGSCNDCPLVLNNEDLENCEKRVRRETIALINRQKAEIERLEIRNKALTEITKNYDWKFKKAKSETIKEFAERVKNECEGGGWLEIRESDFDTLVKEMTENDFKE